FRSTSAANASQVVSSRALIVYVATSGTAIDSVEERQHALGEQCRGLGVVRRERRGGEQMLRRRIEEQLRSVARFDEGAGWFDVTQEEVVARLAVHLRRDVLRPRLAE